MALCSVHVSYRPSCSDCATLWCQLALARNLQHTQTRARAHTHTHTHTGEPQGEDVAGRGAEGRQGSDLALQGQQVSADPRGEAGAEEAHQVRRQADGHPRNLRVPQQVPGDLCHGEQVRRGVEFLGIGGVWWCAWCEWGGYPGPSAQ